MKNEEYFPVLNELYRILNFNAAGERLPAVSLPAMVLKKITTKDGLEAAMTLFGLESYGDFTKGLYELEKAFKKHEPRLLSPTE